MRGYDRRRRDLWSATRWQTFYLMSVGMADIKKAGITGPKDLIEFPWDDETKPKADISQQDEENLQAMMREINNKERGTE